MLVLQTRSLTCGKAFTRRCIQYYLVHTQNLSVIRCRSLPVHAAVALSSVVVFIVVMSPFVEAFFTELAESIQ